MASSTRTTSSRSRASTAKSDLYLQQKIKKETAKKKIEYVQKESELVCQRAKIEADALIQKAKIETQLMRIKAEEDSEVAEISMKILEEELQDICNCSDNGSEFGDWIASHTKRYVENSHIEADRLLTPEPAIPPIRTPFVGTRPEFPDTVTPPPSPTTPAAPPDSILNPCARLFVPENFVSQSSACEPNKQSGINQALMDMTNFLTKKSFILERVKAFVGDSESYLAWKSTFQEVMKEIDASPSIELDLMIKNLEGKPYEQVKSIKNSNTGDSTLGVQKAWERLDSFYGSPDRIARALKRKLSDVLEKFDFNNRPDYFCLSDTLNEINAVKDNPKYSKTLSYFDTSDGVKPVLLKLPIHVQNKWRDKAIQYKKNNDVVYPPFCVFCTFVQEMAYVMNDPGFDFEFKPIHLVPKTKSNKQFHRQTVTSNKTDVLQDESQAKVRCAVHNSAHSTSDCNAFRTKSIGEKRDILRRHGQCFKCCDGKHLSNDCRVKVKCDTCGSRHHCTAMHFDTSNRPAQNHGGEKLTGEKPAFHRQTAETTTHLNAACTEICGDFRGKSCAKIVLVSVHHKHSEHPPVNVYAILDEQSNKSLAKPELFEMFDPNSTCESYKLSTCSGSSLVSGRRSHGFVINSMDRQTTFSLPTLIECSAIPNNRHEIPTCDVAIHHPHLAQISSFIPPMDHTANISLLIGRDLLGAHYVLDQIRGDPSQPYAQRLPLGWVVIGETCLDGIHTPKSVDVMKTMCSNSEQPSQGIWIPCDQMMHITECIENQSVFRRTTTDNQPSLSVEDRVFLTQMDSDMKKDSSGHWSAPLPFKRTRPTLPNNRRQALDRAVSLDKSLMKNPTKKTHFLEFMRNLFEAGHIELAPQLPPNTECWYLPLFGVYHPQKRDKIRGVFDSSAKCDGVSLNDVLMTGPDLMNNLIGVLLRFRRESVAIVADIEQMFYSFLVDIEHRRYLRFIWHKDNNFDEPLVDYQMKVHVFGNSPSPAVATYGLRRTADEAEEQYGSDMKEFVHRNFYVDDALSSHSSAEDAIDLLKRTQKALMEHGCLRLHKIASNSSEVLAAFSSQDLAKDLKDTELWADDLPTQRSLGICWNLQHDYFTFKVNMEDKPFTRRGVLSSINSLFDPLGFVAPVTIAGKAILREAMTSGLDWDEPLPPDFLQKWIVWKSSLKDLEHLQIPRTFSEMSVSKANYKELLIFSDASTMAIAAVAFLRQVSDTGKEQLGFIMGKAKLAPKHGHTVPRLELCAAVMATELYELIAAEIDTNLDSVRFFTDSKVVLGYIRNETKRFFTYVANRVERIRKSSEPKDWNYIPTKMNPADEGTRSVAAKEMQASLWLNGLSKLLDSSENEHYDLDIDCDPEVRSCKTELQSICRLGSHRFERFSDWLRLTRAICFIQNMIRKWKQSKYDEDEDQEPLTLKEAELLIIREIQDEKFPEEIEALKAGRIVNKSSPIFNLDPYLDEDDLLRVGGRLRHSNLTSQEKNPLIVPKKSHIANLLVDHFHREVKHQGRLFTEGAIRSAGFWIVGCRRLVNSHIQKCVSCRKLRGKQQQPKMADLFEAHLHPAPPFTHIGVDVFGPWSIVNRKTRGGQAQAKRWAVIFTCLVIRAIHIEVIEELSTSSFINALRRLTALRGEVRTICSDRGTNFIGATSEMNVNMIDIKDAPLKDFMERRGIQWKFNPPHASHMGGAWERLIGVSRKILDSLLTDPKVTRLSHEVLVTLMAEVCSIVNARPLSGVTYDPDLPYPLSPATLLTLKTRHTVDSFDLEEFSTKDLMKDQWRCVQQLSNCFWKRWNMEYLSLLQQRKKWQQDERNLQVGDVVLLRDKTLHRNDWPMGIVENTYPSDDARVRKIEVRIGMDRKIFKRPATEVVLLVPNKQ